MKCLSSNFCKDHKEHIPNTIILLPMVLSMMVFNLYTINPIITIALAFLLLGLQLVLCLCFYLRILSSFFFVSSVKSPWPFFCFLVTLWCSLCWYGTGYGFLSNILSRILFVMNNLNLSGPQELVYYQFNVWIKHGEAAAFSFYVLHDFQRPAGLLLIWSSCI